MFFLTVLKIYPSYGTVWLQHWLNYRKKHETVYLVSSVTRCHSSFAGKLSKKEATLDEGKVKLEFWPKKGLYIFWYSHDRVLQNVKDVCIYNKTLPYYKGSDTITIRGQSFSFNPKFATYLFQIWQKSLLWPKMSFLSYVLFFVL